MSGNAAGRPGVWAVIVGLVVEAATAEEARALVEAELAKKLPSADRPWQAEQPHLLPRYQVGGAHLTTRLDERGEPAE